MEKRINLVAILKDCPKGMELDCTMFDGLELDHIEESSCYPIKCRVKCYGGGYNIYAFNKYGHWNEYFNAKCVIFPKGKTTWEGFVPPCKFKDGDILYARDEGKEFIFILKHIFEHGKVYCYLSLKGDDLIIQEVWLTDYNPTHRLATEEETEKLFHAIKAKGYKWNSETKALEKLFHYNIGTKVWVKSDKEHRHIHTIVGISRNSFGNLEYEVKEEETGIIVHYPESLLIPITIEKPKFKVGDRIRHKIVNFIHVITEIKDEYYIMDEVSFPHGILPIEAQDEYELVPDKFDVTTLKPYDKVLARCSSLEKWRIQLFEKFDKTCKFPFICMGYNKYKQCIPYEGNEHLLGTYDDCDEYYKTWE